MKTLRFALLATLLMTPYFSSAETSSPATQSGDDWKKITFEEKGKKKYAWFNAKDINRSKTSEISLYVLTPEKKITNADLVSYNSLRVPYNLKVVNKGFTGSFNDTLEYSVITTDRKGSFPGTETRTLGASAWEQANPPDYQDEMLFGWKLREVLMNPYKPGTVKVIVKLAKNRSFPFENVLATNDPGEKPSDRDALRTTAFDLRSKLIAGKGLTKREADLKQMYESNSANKKPLINEIETYLQNSSDHTGMNAASYKPPSASPSNTKVPLTPSKFSIIIPQRLLTEAVARAAQRGVIPLSDAEKRLLTKKQAAEYDKTYNAAKSKRHNIAAKFRAIIAESIKDDAAKAAYRKAATSKKPTAASINAALPKEPGKPEPAKSEELETLLNEEEQNYFLSPDELKKYEEQVISAQKNNADKNLQEYLKGLRATIKNRPAYVKPTGPESFGQLQPFAQQKFCAGLPTPVAADNPSGKTRATDWANEGATGAALEQLEREARRAAAKSQVTPGGFPEAVGLCAQLKNALASGTNGVTPTNPGKGKATDETGVAAKLDNRNTPVAESGLKQLSKKLINPELLINGVLGGVIGSMFGLAAASATPYVIAGFAVGYGITLLQQYRTK